MKQNQVGAPPRFMYFIAATVAIVLVLFFTWAISSLLTIAAIRIFAALCISAIMAFPISGMLVDLYLLHRISDEDDEDEDEF